MIVSAAKIVTSGSAAFANVVLVQYRGNAITGMLIALTALMVLMSAGCNSSVGPTSGKVQFEEGSPVQSGRIEFRSLENGNRYASRIDSTGRFHPVDPSGRPGLPPGEYEAVVVQWVLTEDLAAADHDHGRTVPRRYADYYTSGLTTRITKTAGEIEISLAVE